MKTDDKIQKVTSELSSEMLLGELFAEPEAEFRPVPHMDTTKHPTWRIRLNLTFSPHVQIALDVNGEVTLGRDKDSDGYVCLFDPTDAEQLGVSRSHAMLHPTDSKLYLIDLGSTNGTWLNGRSIGVNMPYSLSNGDVLRFGRLEAFVQIIKRPGHTTHFNAKAGITEAAPTVAKAIMTQLEVKEALKQAAEMAMSYTPADEVTVWLVDEQTGELFLEVGKGVNDGHLSRLPVVDTLAGKVIKTGKALCVNRQSDGDPIKLKTNYLAEAVIYVPLTLGGVTFGVISAVHRERGKTFSSVDEKVMTLIADLAAIAVQNARVHQATVRALTLQTKLVTATHHALSHELKRSVKSVIGYAGLLRSDPSLTEETREIADLIVNTGDRMARLFDQLVEVMTPSEDRLLRLKSCDLVEEVNHVVDDQQAAAAAKQIRLEVQLMGDPYLIHADSVQLRRSVLNLVDNAIRYSPPGSVVMISLGFWHDNVLISVCDTGPGLPEDEIPHLFDRYFRGRASFDGHIGLGLGLEFVRATVEAHQGTITARNTEEQGAEFTISLPNSLRVL